MDCSPSGSSVHGLLLARILEWVAMSSSRGSSRPRDRTQVSYVSSICRWILYHWCHLGSPEKIKWSVYMLKKKRKGKHYEENPEPIPKYKYDI